MLLYSLRRNLFLTEAFVTDFKYKESCMFLQISNSSAILIFNARSLQSAYGEEAVRVWCGRAERAGGRLSVVCACVPWAIW